MYQLWSPCFLLSSAQPHIYVVQLKVWPRQVNQSIPFLQSSQQFMTTKSNRLSQTIYNKAHWISWSITGGIDKARKWISLDLARGLTLTGIINRVMDIYVETLFPWVSRIHDVNFWRKCRMIFFGESMMQYVRIIITLCRSGMSLDFLVFHLERYFLHFEFYSKFW